MLDWKFKHFNDLNLYEFHDILALRIKVFVVEQNCPYQDLDGKDKKSFHLICTKEEGNILGTLRILPPGIQYDEVAIGRIVLDPSIRGGKYGHEMMNEALAFIREEYGNVPVKISGQKHLEGFYESHQFKSTGKEYLEDGIPHVEMIYNPKN